MTALYVTRPDYSRADVRPEPGDVVFLARVTRNGSLEIEAAPSHYRTNRSHVPTLWGWCGETNNRSVDACGVGVVTRITVDGERMRVRRIPRGSAAEAEAVEKARAQAKAAAAQVAAAAAHYASLYPNE